MRKMRERRNERSEVASGNQRSEVAHHNPNNPSILCNTPSILCNLRPPGEVYIIYLIGLLVLGVFTPACPAPSKSSEATGSSAAAESAPPEAPPAAPREKPELSFSLRIHELSGVISELVLQPEAEFEMEPAQRIEVIANQPLVDFRVRLMDSQERVLPSDEEISFDPKATTVNIQLLSGLKPATSLVLLVDSQLSQHILNAEGDRYDDFRATLKVRGEPEKPAAQPQTPPKKHPKNTKTKARAKNPR